MKGFVFTEFLNLIEKEYGIETVDRIISMSNIKSGGVYTSIGTYHHEELLAMITSLSSLTAISTSDLLRAYGEYMFGVFLKKYSSVIHDFDNMLDFLEKIDSHIHVEVAKLYPDAELPKFDYKRHNPTKLELIYNSKRKLGFFAEGLIIGCAKHYRKRISLDRVLLASDSAESVKFTIEVLP